MKSRVQHRHTLGNSTGRECIELLDYEALPTGESAAYVPQNPKNTQVVGSSNKNRESIWQERIPDALIERTCNQRANSNDVGNDATHEARTVPSHASMTSDDEVRRRHRGRRTRRTRELFRPDTVTSCDLRQRWC